MKFQKLTETIFKINPSEVDLAEVGGEEMEDFRDKLKYFSKVLKARFNYESERGERYIVPSEATEENKK